ncbi:MAG: hypothetical protein SPI30_04955 [Prevotella sp.]|nr:hypothetical protein [Prevotella sp.]
MHWYHPYQCLVGFVPMVGMARTSRWYNVGIRRDELTSNTIAAQGCRFLCCDCGYIRKWLFYLSSG